MAMSDAVDDIAASRMTEQDSRAYVFCDGPESGHGARFVFFFLLVTTLRDGTDKIDQSEFAASGSRHRTGRHRADPTDRPMQHLG
ncbi:hypothetical protein G3I13_07545 [Streptomyces sp. SID6673]|nr:hypothetical protein [Streptomyces sp. SID11726]NEB24181.1 hypothetical protein [Streptomyces sp. SID6673]